MVMRQPWAAQVVASNGMDGTNNPNHGVLAVAKNGQ
jgi:hypothetical protein